ncbi:MAG: radical SAM protein, partial [Gammaproteobacteria bacterium]
QFYPTYKMLDRPPTPAATLQRAREIGLDAGLHYVYEGNVPGGEGENTYCHHCHALLIERYGYVVRENRIVNERCADCQTPVAGVAMSGS